MVQKIVVIAVIIGAIVIGEISGREIASESPDKECFSNSECGVEECCVLGPSRSTKPICIPRRAEGADCRPNNNPVNKTIDDIAGNKFTLTNVHDILCPCANGLHCDKNDGGKCHA